jgi:hypothetical protein
VVVEALQPEAPVVVVGRLAVSPAAQAERDRRPPRLPSTEDPLPTAAGAGDEGDAVRGRSATDGDGHGLRPCSCRRLSGPGA